MPGVMMAIDRLGVLNVFQYGTAPSIGCQGPQLVGFATLVPGSPLAMFAQSQSLYTALTVDKNGTINVASYDMAAGALGMDTIGDRDSCRAQYYDFRAHADLAHGVDDRSQWRLQFAVRRCEQHLARSRHVWQRGLRSRVRNSGPLPKRNTVPRSRRRQEQRSQQFPLRYSRRLEWPGYGQRAKWTRRRVTQAGTSTKMESITKASVRRTA